jgi:uncharacterized protein YeaO (DUF488 family)
MVKIKRIYDPASRADGRRIYIDRLWPRGMKKEDAKMDEWLKELSPSDTLRKWYAHDPERYAEFKRRYIGELKLQRETLAKLRKAAKKQTITLLFSAKDAEHSNATVLKEVLSH